MIAGVASNNCHIPIPDSEVGDNWNAAISYSLHWLLFNMVEASQDHLGLSYEALISDVETPPQSFQLCLKHVAERKLGASSLSAKEILAKLERLHVD